MFNVAGIESLEFGGVKAYELSGRGLAGWGPAAGAGSREKNGGTADGGGTEVESAGSSFEGRDEVEGGGG